mgnify:CR=1 FL=1
MPRGEYTPFTESQKQMIRDEYLNMPVKSIAKELNTTYGRIMRFLNRNDLRIPRALVEKRKRESRLQNGHHPFNKGKKQEQYMSAEAIQRSAKGRFKKGNKPHNQNANGNGAIVTRTDSSGRKYKYIRVNVGVWKLYHRHLWESVNGPIPTEYIVAFKDDNSENVVIDNLELISMTENMYRNSKHNYPQEIIPSLLLSKQLENKLKTLENG